MSWREDLELKKRNIATCRNNDCHDVENDSTKGYFRGLVLEEEGRDAGAGAVVIGINPGKPKGKWKEPYLEIVEKWQSYSSGKYYQGIRNILKALGLNGPILWTELVKCHMTNDKTMPSMQTLRTCVSKHLNEEILLSPDSWPLFALGKEAYRALCYLYPDRLVVGIPHPTGSYGYFANLFEEKGADRKLKALYTNWYLANIGSKNVAWFDDHLTI